METKKPAATIPERKDDPNIDKPSDGPNPPEVKKVVGDDGGDEPSLGQQLINEHYVKIK